MCGWLSRINFEITHTIFEDQNRIYVLSLFSTGLLAPVQVRTCFLDDCVETFIRQQQQKQVRNNGCNIVILGSGYDTRCYRLDLIKEGNDEGKINSNTNSNISINNNNNVNINLFEVDAPGTQQEKKRILRDIFPSIETTTTNAEDNDNVVTTTTIITTTTTVTKGGGGGRVHFCPCNFETEDW